MADTFDVQREMETLLEGFSFAKLYAWLEGRPDDFAAVQSDPERCPLAKYFRAHSEYGEEYNVCNDILEHVCNDILEHWSGYVELDQRLCNFYCTFDLTAFGLRDRVSRDELLAFVAPYVEVEKLQQHGG